MLKGSCLCGAVSFSLTPGTRATTCHCTQCRKQSGNHWASGRVEAKDLDLTGEVTWYAASDHAKRGFCGTCGSFLFWKHNEESELAFSLGLIDGPTGLTYEEHLNVADKGDYYEIADDVPQREH